MPWEASCRLATSGEGSWDINNTLQILYWFLFIYYWTCSCHALQWPNFQAYIWHHPALLAALVHVSPQRPSHWLDFLTIRLCPHSFTFYSFLSQNPTKRNHHSFHMLLTIIQSTGSATVHRADLIVTYKPPVAWSLCKQVQWLDMTLLQIFNLKQLYLNQE